jgi:hypothetical protein
MAEQIACPPGAPPVPLSHEETGRMALIDGLAGPQAVRVRAERPRQGETGVTLHRMSAADKLLPDWRGLLDIALEDNPFMCPEFMQPAAAHLVRGAEVMLAAAWRQHARSRELIGLFILAPHRPRGLAWLQPRTVALWSGGPLPLAPMLLSPDPDAASAAIAALVAFADDAQAGHLVFPAVDAAGPAAPLIAAVASDQGLGLSRLDDASHSRGLDFMIAPEHVGLDVTVTSEPSGLRAMLEQALAMDAGMIEGEAGMAAAVFDTAELAFLRAVVRGFSRNARIVMARVDDGGRKAVAIALLARDRAYLWRIFGRSADEPMAQLALARAIMTASGRAVHAAAARPIAGFCTTPLRTATLDVSLR